MNFVLHTTDQKGNPVKGVIATVNILDGPELYSGKSYTRTADGSGGSTISLETAPPGLDVFLRVDATGYYIWNNMDNVGPLKTTKEDQMIEVTLIPFV